MLPAVRDMTDDKRRAAADLIRQLPDFALPELDYFNSSPCAQHASIEEGMNQIPPCRRCGIHFRKHQRVGIAWLYTRGRGLIADQVGTGKTPQVAGLLAVLKQAGELDGQRAVVICRPAALPQWEQELTRFLPRLQLSTGTGTRKQRIDKYLAPWDVLLIGNPMFVIDIEDLMRFNIKTIVVDDVDALRHRSTQTAYAIKRLARTCDRAVVLTATPLQKQLLELHSVLEPVGGLEVFGSQTRFRQRFVREELVKLYNSKIGRFTNVRKVTGYKNLDELIQLATPLTLRRTPDHIDDVELPAIAPPNNVYLDLYPAQKTAYEQLRKGVLRIIKSEGARVTRTTAAAQFLRGAQICAGLVNLDGDDRPNSSVKLDWVQSVLNGDLSEEKVVIFCQFTATVDALAKRLTTDNIGHVIIWGREPNKTVRKAAQDRFWDDPDCRVLIGTSAIEQSLNLQNARHLINVDQLMNPARMQQLAGRIRRDGSAYKTVYVHNLLARHTQEEGYLDLLAREQALADHVWGESNQLYEALSPLALLQLIGGR